MTGADARTQALIQIWNAAVAAVSGYEAVAKALSADSDFNPDLVFAVGKAAVGMCQGALDNLPPCEALIVTKYDHANENIRARAGVKVVEAGHPIPDSKSLEAGQLLLDRIGAMPSNSRVLLLVSGGASALAEALPEGMSLADLQSITDEMIAGGNTIGQINARRKETSLIKDGKLIEAFKGAEIRVYAISDVEGDSIATIGSGLGDCHRAGATANSTVIASNRIAREYAAQQARDLGLNVRLNQESLYGDVFELAPVIAASLDRADPGVYIWGGEPTVVLPECPGRGGRNQSLALALAEHITGQDNVSILVAGTDGTDGPTTAAGGLVDGNTWNEPEAARLALRNADAGSYLEQRQSLFVTGPTNTNVMDLAIAIIS
jgi:hydroxypyruvate reductase